MLVRDRERDFSRYLSTMMWLSVVHSPVDIVTTFLGIRSAWILFYLAMSAAVDLALVKRYFWQSKLHPIEVILLLLLLSTLPIGLINTPEFSRRHLTDFLLPLLFLLKIGILRGLLASPNKTRDLLDFVPKFAIYNAISAVVSVVMYLVASRLRSMYLGLTPDLYGIVALTATAKGAAPVLGSLALVLFTGKRSMLLGALLITAIAKFRSLREFVRFALVAPMLILLVGVVSWSAIQNTAAFQKYGLTISMLGDALENPKVVDYLTGGRVSEVEGTLATMQGLDYVLGKGVGFTYYLELFDEKHANAHFTPITIISKYGGPFYLLVMVHVFTILLASRRPAARKESINQFFFLYLCAINLDFLFAFSFFTNPMFPIGLGYLSSQLEPGAEPPSTRSSPPADQSCPASGSETN